MLPDQTQTNMFAVCAKLDPKLFAVSTIILQNFALCLNYNVNLKKHFMNVTTKAFKILIFKNCYIDKSNDIVEHLENSTDAPIKEDF